MSLLLPGIAIIGIILWTINGILKEIFGNADSFIENLIVFILFCWIVKSTFIWLFL